LSYCGGGSPPCFNTVQVDASIAYHCMFVHRMHPVLLVSFLLLALIALHTNAFAPKRQSGILRISTSRSLFGNPPEAPKGPAAGGQKKDGGLFGGMGNLMESVKKAQEIAKQAEVINKELMDTIIIGQDPSGQVSATFNGLGMPIGIKISDSILSQGSEAVSLASTQAMVDAHSKSQATMMGKMQALYGGALPGMPK